MEVIANPVTLFCRVYAMTKCHPLLLIWCGGGLPRRLVGGVSRRLERLLDIGVGGLSILRVRGAREKFGIGVGDLESAR